MATVKGQPAVTIRKRKTAAGTNVSQPPRPARTRSSDHQNQGSHAKLYRQTPQLRAPQIMIQPLIEAMSAASMARSAPRSAAPGEAKGPRGKNAQVDHRQDGRGQRHGKAEIEGQQDAEFQRG